MSIHDLIEQHASDDVIAGLASTTGESQTSIKAAMSGAIPAVLLILIDKCSTPSGAGVVFDALDARSPSMLDRLPSAFVSNSAHLLIETGYRHLNSVIGRPESDDLLHAIGRFAGISQPAAHGVVGMASCISLATIARHVAPSDPHALASALNDEKPAVLPMLPPELRQHLDEALSLRPLAHQYDTGYPATATDDAMQDEASLTRQENVHNERYYRVDQSSGIPQEIAWIIPILFVAAIILATVFLLHPRSDTMTGTPRRSPADDAAVPAAAIVPSAEPAPAPPLNLPADPTLGKDLSSLLESIGRKLSRPASMTQRQRDLREQLAELQSLGSRIARLPASQRRAAAVAISQRLPELETLSSSTVMGEDPLSRQKASQILQELRSIAQEPL